MLRYSMTLFVAIAAVIFVCKNPVDANVLEWDQTKIEFEMEPWAEEATAEFVATNVSDKTVRIDRIRTSCGCTGSILSKKEIKPGESATIVGTFKKGSRQGLNHNRLEVYLKGQSKAEETLHMLVQVQRLIDVKPSIIFWNRSSSKTEREVKIKLDERYVDTISEIKYDPELFTIRKEPIEDSATEYMLYILPMSFEKQLRHPVIIKAKGSDDKVAEAKIQVFVQP